MSILIAAMLTAMAAFGFTMLIRRVNPTAALRIEPVRIDSTQQLSTDELIERNRRLRREDRQQEHIDWDNEYRELSNTVPPPALPKALSEPPAWAEEEMEREIAFVHAQLNAQALHSEEPLQ